MSPEQAYFDMEGHGDHSPGVVPEISGKAIKQASIDEFEARVKEKVDILINDLIKEVQNGRKNSRSAGKD